MIARLKPGATIAEAQSQIDAHNAAVEKDNPEAKMMAEAGFRSPVVSLHADHVRSIRPTLWLMQVGVFFLLLIGAVNLVNLLLIRASGRAKEMAIRQSMGASRRHVVSQVMVETVLLPLFGGLLGLVVGAWGIRLLEILGADRLPLGAHIVFDGWLASIGLVGAILLGVVIAVPIAWFNLSTHLANTLQSESRTGTISRAAQRLRHGFIVAQIALAFVLLAGAALLGLSLKKVMAVSPGFRADQILTGDCTISWQLARDSVGIVDRLLESIRQQPGIAAAGTITNIPLSGDNAKTAITPKGYVPPPGQSLHGHYSYGVNGDYFSALGIPLREGRFLTSADSHRSERVCVVDEDFARRYWPKGSALGQQLFHPGVTGRDQPWSGSRKSEAEEGNLFTIVGVVGAVKQAELTEEQGQGAVYLPYGYLNGASVFVVIRTSQRPEAFAETLRKLVRAADPDLAIRSRPLYGNAHRGESHHAPLTGAARGNFRGRRTPPGGGWNLRRSELRRRATHGARSAFAWRLARKRSQIGTQFLSLGLRLLAAGTILGLIGAWLAGRAIQSVLFDVPILPRRHSSRHCARHDCGVIRCLPNPCAASRTR